MPEVVATKSERIGVAITPAELAALEFIERLHGDRYDGTSTVLRDYSLTDAVEFHRRALAEVRGDEQRRATGRARG